MKRGSDSSVSEPATISICVINWNRGYSLDMFVTENYSYYRHLESETGNSCHIVILVSPLSKSTCLIPLSLNPRKIKARKIWPVAQLSWITANPHKLSYRRCRSIQHEHHVPPRRAHMRIWRRHDRARRPRA